jgi:hypothetical protein
VSAEPPDLESPEQPVEGPATIFVSDPSAEADRLSTALRGKGYNVIDVPLSLLVARVAVQMPSLILLDVDAEGALDEVGRLRAIPGAAGIDIIFLGDPGSTLSQSSEALQRDGSGFLPRPVDVDALLQKTALLIGAQPSEPASVTGIASVRPGATQERASPSSTRRRSPLPEPWSERPGPLSADDALEPSFGTGAPSAPKLPLPALSPEIEKLLQGAEERSHELGAPSHLPPSEPPSPDEEVDAVLPAEVLAALDEPLDENDDDLESDAGSSTSVPKKITTGGPGATPSGVSQAGTGPGTGTGTGTSGESPSGPPPRLPALEMPAPPSAPFSFVPSDLGDPKEMETPRPPRRAPASAPPMPNVPQPPAPPREFAPPAPPLPSALPAPMSPLRRSSGPISTVPPGPSRSRGSSPPRPTSAPPLAEPSRPQASTKKGTVPPRYSTSPPATPLDAHNASDPPLPATPRDLRLGRRSDSVPATEAFRDSMRDSVVGVAPAELPEELGLGDALQAFAICVRERATGALCIDAPEGVRRLLLRDGDVVTAASGIDEESLVAFLGTRGDIPREIAGQLHGKIPAFGRHAGAALVANGHISQDQLWPVLRAHAEWILACAIGAERGAASFEVSPPGRLRAEPSVFGGATGSEVLIEVVRRSVPIDLALARVGGGDARIAEGPRWELLSECALPEAEQEWLGRAKGSTIDEAMSLASTDLLPMVYALVQLGVLAVDVVAPRTRKRRQGQAPGFDPIDAQALRSQVKARLSLVEEGDYFSLLGVPRSATSYEIHRAYLELRHGLEPSRVLNAATADLADDIELIIEVLDEAHDILRDQARRERYRRAIEDKPPA